MGSNVRLITFFFLLLQKLSSQINSEEQTDSDSNLTGNAMDKTTSKICLKLKIILAEDRGVIGEDCPPN